MEIIFMLQIFGTFVIGYLTGYHAFKSYLRRWINQNEDETILKEMREFAKNKKRKDL